MSVRPSLTETPCADLTDVTLADEDTKSILTDNVNRAIQGNVRKSYLVRKSYIVRKSFLVRKNYLVRKSFLARKSYLVRKSYPVRKTYLVRKVI